MHPVVAMLKRSVREYCHHVLQPGSHFGDSSKLLQSRAWRLLAVDLDAVFIYLQLPFAGTGPFPDYIRREKANYQDQASNERNPQ